MLFLEFSLFFLFLLPLNLFSQQFDAFYFKRSADNSEIDDINSVGNYVLNNIDNGRLIGCKYTSICPENRKCFDDNLFGTCISINESPDFVYDVAPELQKILELAMQDLFREKYRWIDFYTQCFLQSVIKSSEMQQFLDVKHCKRNPKRRVESTKYDKSNLLYYPSDRDRMSRLEYNNRRMMSPEYDIDVNDENVGDRGDGGGSRDGGGVRVARESNAIHVDNNESINPLANSEEAKSSSTVGYADAQKVRKELNIAKRKRNEWVWLKFNRNITNLEKPELKQSINDVLNFPKPLEDFQFSPDGSTIYFKLSIDAAVVSRNITEYFKQNRLVLPRYTIVDVGIGYRTNDIQAVALTNNPSYNKNDFKSVIIVCSVVLACLVFVLIGFCIQKIRYRKDKLGEVINSKLNEHAPKNYVDLFRVSNKENGPSIKTKQGVGSRLINNKQTSGEGAGPSSPGSTRSSTSSWTDDPSTAPNMDIYTGHMILTYMEKHLKDKKMFHSEWEAVGSYEAEDSRTTIASMPENAAKNRFKDKLPYDKSRVALKEKKNGNDYINASFIFDRDPKLPAYIVAQTPLPTENCGDFWQMIWEQGTVVIVTLIELEEVETFWPTAEGSMIYNNYEVNLVSEHIWSDEYLVRNFYLKSLKCGETRTVTQFHYLRWVHDKVPLSCRSILEFRRKVNKSYRSKTTPILIQCSDGCGRTGTYVLLDLVLNSIGKGMKEMDIVATLEHLRDQRMALVSTEEQFSFVLSTISEEVNAILKVLNN